MTTTKPKLLTADDLLRLDSEGVKGELIMGVLHKKVSSGLEHGQIVPDLVVEIISPNDRPVPVFDKAQMWLRHGVRLVWITDPEARTITALPQSGPARTYTEDDTLDGGEVLPGFTCPVSDIFEV